MRIPRPVAPSSPRPAWAAWAWLVLGLGSRIYLVAIAALAACALAPMLLGLTGSVVQSGSMEPTISAGDVVLAHPLRSGDPVPMGRVVTFAAPEGSNHEGLLLHRIVAEGEGGTLVTAGDANAVVDSAPLSPMDVIARACLLIPWIGLPALWAGTGQWFPLAVWIVVTVLALVTETVSAAGGRSGRRPSSDTSTDPVVRRRTRRRVPVPVAIAGILLVGPMAAIGAITTTADAAFSARTASVGSSWSAAVAAPAAKLAFSMQPSSSTGGRAFASQPVVAVKNAAGGNVTGTRTVTLSLTHANGAVLTCAANPVTSATGLVAFTGCAIDKIGTYTLTASSGTLTAAVSTALTITVGPGTTMRFTTQPSAALAGTVFATQPSVAILDAGGNATTSTAAVALSLTTPAGATLTCTANPRSAVSGTATFAGCRVSKAGTYTLTATSASLTSAVSATFVISPPAPPQLTCRSDVWYATYSWSPTPYAPTTYHLYVNGVQVDATGADGWNSYVQLSTSNVPASRFPQGTATVEVRKLLSNGTEEIVGVGKVTLGAAAFRTYLCG